MNSYASPNKFARKKNLLYWLNYTNHLLLPKILIKSQITYVQQLIRLVMPILI